MAALSQTGSEPNWAGSWAEEAQYRAQWTHEWAQHPLGQTNAYAPGNLQLASAGST
jgi:hypothetical protein